MVYPQKRINELIKDWSNTDLGISSAYIIEGSHDGPCLMVVNGATVAGSFVPFFFEGENGKKEAMVEVHPSDLPFLFDQSIAPDDLKMPKGWKIGEKIYDGNLLYEDISELFSDLKDFPYLLELDDNPALRQIGFKCQEIGRSWHIDIKHLKENTSPELDSLLRSEKGRKKLLEKLNTKPKAEPLEI